MVVGVAAAAGLALWAFIRFTSLGKAIRAASQDPHAAQTLGIDIQRIYTVSFGIGAALAGLAGGLLISIYPAHPTVGFQPVIKSIACVILGGLGYVPGAIIAAMLLGIIEAYARSEEHTSELQSLMRISYAVFCLKKKNKQT